MRHSSSEHLNVHAIATADAEHAGDEMWADLSPRDDRGLVDRTHLNATGSEVVARLLVDALRKAVPELAGYLSIHTRSGGQGFLF